VRALVVADGRVAVASRPDPEPSEGEARVRIHLAGVCDTDLQIVRGYMGFEGVLGHEWVGHVEEGPPPWQGCRVVGEINFACGRCPRCAAGLGRHCPTRRVMGIQDADGAFAERAVVPVANLHAVPDAVGDEAAVFAEPLAAAFEIREQLGSVAGARAVVLGDGKLGLLAAQVLHEAGATVRAVGHHAAKLDRLARRGIATRLEAAWDAAAEQADLVVEATGSAGGLARALEATRPRGTLVLKSTVADRLDVDLAPVVIHEIRVQGSRCGPFPPALDALARGSVEVASLVDARVPLARADEALARAARPGALKVLVDCA
jgi:threonine dehydrogenase-like Zn-dependent dehydrogenase